MVLDVSDGLLEVKEAEVVADGDALVEGLVGSETEELSQVGLTEQDQGEQGGRVHLFVEQEAELVKDIGRQAVSFVDAKRKQEGPALAGQVGQGGTKLRQEAIEGVGRFDLQGEENLAVESGDLEMGVGQVGDGVEVAVEGMDEGA